MRHELGDVIRIKHVLAAISDIEIILEGVELKEFLENREKRYAVERLLEIIGEATNNLSEEILYDTKYNTPWRKIIATRNALIHEYFRIDYDIIYGIATTDILPLKKEIEMILKILE